mmetsp:Transcript_4365/g.9616  ORF Transcript_4365/g.9616 Transcript_4365/m.9616 type:complete len:671 (+) Transcript_4365:85-2097(+)
MVTRPDGNADEASFLEGGEATSFLVHEMEMEEQQHSSSNGSAKKSHFLTGRGLLLTAAGAAGTAGVCLVAAGLFESRGGNVDIGLNKVSGPATIEAFDQDLASPNQILGTFGQNLRTTHENAGTFAKILEPSDANLVAFSQTVGANPETSRSYSASSTIDQGNEQSQQKTTKWAVWISDIHVDPLYGIPSTPSGSACVAYSSSKVFPESATANNPYGIIGCDPPPSLWDSALEAVRKVSRKFDPDALIFTGDFVRHVPDYTENPIETVSDLIGRAADEISEKFKVLGPSAKLVGTLGNDDNPRNYQLNVTNTPSNPWFRRVGGELREAGTMPYTREEAYKMGGYYATEFHNILVLNIQTVTYSMFFAGENPDEDDPFGQFHWLEQQLTTASEKGQKVWIIGHVPPGIETFGYKALWKPKYVDRYMAIVQDKTLGKVIAAQFFGHTHSDEFRLLPDAPEGAGAMLISSAISPIYSNQPNVRLIEYDVDTGLIQNMKVWWANITEATTTTPIEWKSGYTWRDIYPAYPDPAGLTNAGLTSWSKKLEEAAIAGGDEWTQYTEWYKAKYANPLMKTRKDDPDSTEDEKLRLLKEYFCAVKVQNQDAYNDCAGISSSSLEETELPATSDDFAVMEYYRKANEKFWSRFPRLAKAMGHVFRNFAKAHAGPPPTHSD